MTISKLPGMRRHYEASDMDENNTPDNPFDLFAQWFEQAHDSKIIEPNAMTLATANKQGMPSARIVLLKEVNSQGFVFYTNYLSKKGKEIEENPYGAIVFLWDVLEKQVRIEGRIIKNDAQVASDYFYSRPIGSQIGAIISPQSQKITSKSVLEESYKAVEAAGDIKKPDHWGGYILVPNLIEFWQGRPNRLHDRIQYERNQDTWIKSRLAP